MSWMKGTGPVKDVEDLGISQGLSEDWYSDTDAAKGDRKEIKKGDFWDVIDNPLYQVAADALYDEGWEAWVEAAQESVGSERDSGQTMVRAVIDPGTPTRTTRRRTGRSGFTYEEVMGTPATYENMTRDEAQRRGLDFEGAKTTRWLNKKSGEIFNQPEKEDPATCTGDCIDGKKWKELRDWGISDLDIAADLDEASVWLKEIVNVNDHLRDIIREGPKGEHYGIEGDIWEHYGLDQEPEPPKELEWDSYDTKMQLKQAVTSTVTYSTPEGIAPVDLHGDY